MAAVALVGMGAAAWFWIQHADRPHAVVLISVGTLRADHLPVYGYMAGQTPNLDAFAKDAVVFDRAYAHSPQTLPSHASIMTGLLPFEHGVRDDAGFTLKPNAMTLALLFHQAGYRTAGFVSTNVLGIETGIGRGFDVYDDGFPPGSREPAVAHVRRPGTATLAATEQWLASQADEQFLLFVQINELQLPYSPTGTQTTLAPYDAEVASDDEIVGKLVTNLKRRGWYDGATIVVVSDHGEGLGDHGEREHGLFLYDATTHVPLIVKARGGGAGRRVAEPVQHIDLLPTLAALARLTVPSELRGRSLVPVLSGAGHIPSQGIYAEAPYGYYHFGWSELSSLTDDRYRFIEAPEEELYDLQRDPREARNMMAERAQVGQAMRAALNALVSEQGLALPSVATADARERLAALGYVGTAVASGRSTTTSPDPKDKIRVLSAYRSAVETVSEGRLDEAAAMFKEIVFQEPKMTDAWNQYATALSRLGRNDEAIAAFKEVITQRPGDAAALLDIATLLMQVGRYDEARKHAEIVMGIAPAAASKALAQIELAMHARARGYRDHLP